MSHSQTPTVDPQPRTVHVDLGLDYGTSSTKIAYRCRFHGDAEHGDTKVMAFSDTKLTLPACVAWSKDGFHFGNDLKERVSKGAVPAESVIDCAKVAIYYEANDDNDVKVQPAFVERIFEKLKTAKKSLQELLNEHLKGLVEMARERIREDVDVQQRLGKQGEVEFVFDLRLPVPQMWKEKAINMMHLAVDSADIKTRDIVNEPQCAMAASVALKDAPNDTNHLRGLGDGSYIIVYDLGCGTGDAVLYRLKGAMTTAMKNIMKPVGSAPGTTHCSHRINETIYGYLEARLNLEEPAKRLQMSRGEFKYQLLAAIEKAKLVTPLDPWSNLTIFSKEGVPWNPDGDAKVSAATMEDEYNNVVDGIIDMGDKLLKDHNIIPIPKSDAGQTGSAQLAAVLLLGGFSNSMYVQNKFHQKYKPTDTKVFFPGSMGVGSVINECRVAYGSLCERYAEIRIREIPRQFTYAFLQDELWDGEDHPDCSTRVEESLSRRRSKVVYRPKKGMTKIVDGKEYVVDRLFKVLSRKDIAGREMPHRADEETEYRVFTSELVLRKDFVRIDAGVQFENSDSAIKVPQGRRASELSGFQDWVFKDGIHPWKTVEAELDADQLNANFKKKKDKDGKEYYHIYTVAIVTYTGETMEIGWDILKKLGGEVVYRVVGTQQVWDGARSEFPRDEAEDLGGNGIA